MNFFSDRVLSESASNLIRFDEDSIRQIVSARRLAAPDIWLVDPDSYEKNGRVLRDSNSARMLAYSTKDQILYATDGCNACTRSVGADLESLGPAELKGFAEQNELRLELLERLASIVRS